MMHNEEVRKVPSDGFMPWLVLGVAVSVVMHFVIAFYSLYQPKSEVVQLPAAIPVSVAMVAQIAAPIVEEQAINDGSKQVESIDSVATHSDDAPAEEKEIEPETKEVELASKPPPIIVKESKLDSELAKSQNVEPSESTPKVKQTPAKVKQATPVKPAVSQPASVAKVEQSAPKIEVDNRQEQVQGISGAFNQHLRQVRLDWKQQLVIHLEQHKQYPRRAKRLRKQGVPLITFTMDRAGKVLGVELVRSSGTESLDREALDLVFRAVPLPSPPEEVNGEALTWTVPVRFYVQ
ncbi:TonB family protein [Vibrio europaeus]|uniref:TonB family protein n=1 Tax=Vibrio europaeus TaxID=300876 RepID=UPI00148D0D18|nr:energy transducer TonB [Vibrio europaeus]MDC5821998.1 energy transducer TonB [Vibrio europaeus]MDC5838021.1 energy transducer TonB [Vibrio europaeus]MDC5850492.1 energy transducer TonB [Vibrio europaeus]MDC5870156.1 energy transducer TonB [Vibrio europaeus]NOH22727.1 energy transducer TonB [Vibrio europaeus]